MSLPRLMARKPLRIQWAAASGGAEENQAPRRADGRSQVASIAARNRGCSNCAGMPIETVRS